MASRKRSRAAVEEVVDRLPPWDGPSVTPSAEGTGSPLADLAEILGDAAHAALRPQSSAPPENFDVFTVEHENTLLQEPWPSENVPNVMARHCVFGRRCVAMRLQIPGSAVSGGIVLAETLTPAELQHFHQTGEHPTNEWRPCLLCMRAYITYEYVRYRRHSQGTGGPPYALNTFANPTGEGGYVESYCLPFAEDASVWQGIYGRVAALLPQRLALVQDPETRRWRVDQSAMLHEGRRFDGGTAQWAFASTFGAALCRFIERRPAIWDGHALIGQWGSCGSSLRADLDYRFRRFSEFVEAYGASVGPEVTWAFARAQDLISAISVALDRGASEEEAMRARPPSEDDLPDTTTVIMHAFTVGVAPPCGGKPRVPKNADVSRALIANIISKAAMHGGPPRTVFEASNKALADLKASSVISKLVVCSLIGGYRSCARRPPAAVRRRLIALAETEVAEAARAFPSEMPLVMMAVIEHVGAFVDRNMHAHLPDAGVRGPEWTARHERSQVFLDLVRTQLASVWREGAPLADVFSAGPLFDLIQKLQRRTQKLAVRANPTSPLVHPRSVEALLTAVCKEGVDEAVVHRFALQLAEGGGGGLAELGLHESTARAALALLRAHTSGNCAALRETSNAMALVSPEQRSLVHSLLVARKVRTVIWYHTKVTREMILVSLSMFSPSRDSWRSDEFTCPRGSARCSRRRSDAPAARTPTAPCCSVRCASRSRTWSRTRTPGPRRGGLWVSSRRCRHLRSTTIPRRFAIAPKRATGARCASCPCSETATEDFCSVTGAGPSLRRPAAACCARSTRSGSLKTADGCAFGVMTPRRPPPLISSRAT